MIDCLNFLLINPLDTIFLTNYNSYLVFLLISAGLYSIFALGLNLQWGFTGLINFGHVAFMTIGAYTTVILSTKGVPLILAVASGAILAAILGLLIGISTLRLRADYLSIVTIGISELIRLIALNEEWLTRGAFGMQKYPLPLEDPLLLKYLIRLLEYLPIEDAAINSITQSLTQAVMILVASLVTVFAAWQLYKGLNQQIKYSKKIKGKSYKPISKLSAVIWAILGTYLILTIYINSLVAINRYNYKTGLMLLVLVTLAVIYWLLETLVHSPWGRVLKGIREDEEIPRALGKNVFWYKLQAFMLGGAIAGIAGSFYAWQLTTIYPTNFEPIITFNAWTMVILGGSGSNPGTIVGVIIFWIYDALTRFYLPQLGIFDSSQLGAFRVMMIGLILMILMIWRPQGILGKKEELTLGK